MSATTSSDARLRSEPGGLAARFPRWTEGEEARAALIPYLTAGFPDAGASGRLLRAVADAGADIVELGVPFSDPLADGPTIQRTSFRALQGGMSVRGVLELLEGFREERDTPVVLFSYLNPILRYGSDAFLRDARAAGADGLLVTDLPVGADIGLEEAVPETGLDLIRLVAPTTSEERVRTIAASATGFLYYIARTGVTGARAELREELADEVRGLRGVVSLPVAVGFGISRPEHAAMVASFADGVVVGSALLEKVDAEGVEAGADFIASLRAAVEDVRG